MHASHTQSHVTELQGFTTATTSSTKGLSLADLAKQHHCVASKKVASSQITPGAGTPSLSDLVARHSVQGSKFRGSGLQQASLFGSHPMSSGSTAPSLAGLVSSHIQSNTPRDTHKSATCTCSFALPVAAGVSANPSTSPSPSISATPPSHISTEVVRKESKEQPTLSGVASLHTAHCHRQTTSTERLSLRSLSSPAPAKTQTSSNTSSTGSLSPHVTAAPQHARVEMSGVASRPVTTSEALTVSPSVPSQLSHSPSVSPSAGIPRIAGRPSLSQLASVHASTESVAHTLTSPALPLSTCPQEAGSGPSRLTSTNVIPQRSSFSFSSPVDKSESLQLSLSDLARQHSASKSESKSNRAPQNAEVISLSHLVQSHAKASQPAPSRMKGLSGFIVSDSAQPQPTLTGLAKSSGSSNQLAGASKPSRPPPGFKTLPPSPLPASAGHSATTSPFDTHTNVDKLETLSSVRTFSSSLPSSSPATHPTSGFSVSLRLRVSHHNSSESPLMAAVPSLCAVALCRHYSLRREREVYALVGQTHREVVKGLVLAFDSLAAFDFSSPSPDDIVQQRQTAGFNRKYV